MLNTRLLIGLLSFAAVAQTAFGYISLRISPIEGEPSQYLLEATGQASQGITSTYYGKLTFEGSPFNISQGTPETNTLLFGFKPLVYTRPPAANSYEFEIEDEVVYNPTVAYTFSGTSMVIEGIYPYENLFNVGTYNITHSNGMFGPTTNGALEILESPIPEPSTYAAIFGVFILGCVVIYRRK